MIQIDIIAKYKLNGVTLWYTDQFLNRYTPDELKYIIENSAYPRSLYHLYRDNKHKIQTNMRITSTGKIYSKKNTISSHNVINNNPIAILCEDSASGFVGYKEILYKTFPNVNFCFK